MKKLLLFLSFFVLTLFVNGQAWDAVKIGTIDTDSIMKGEVTIWVKPTEPPHTLYVKNYVTDINGTNITGLSFSEIKELFRVVSEDYTIGINELYSEGLVSYSAYKISYTDGDELTTIFTYYDYSTEERIYDDISLLAVGSGWSGNLDNIGVVLVDAGIFHTVNTQMFSGNTLSYEFFASVLLPE